MSVRKSWEFIMANGRYPFTCKKRYKPLQFSFYCWKLIAIFIFWIKCYQIDEQSTAGLGWRRVCTRGGNRLHSQLPSECDYLQSTRVYGDYQFQEGTAWLRSRKEEDRARRGQTSGCLLEKMGTDNGNSEFGCINSGVANVFFCKRRRLPLDVSTKIHIDFETSVKLRKLEMWYCKTKQPDMMTQSRLRALFLCWYDKCKKRKKNFEFCGPLCFI